MSKNFKVKNGLEVTTHLTASGNVSGSLTSTASFGHFIGNGSGITGVSTDIDGLGDYGAQTIHQTDDHFLISDDGTEKKITFSDLEDSIFANVSGDATIAGGGALTIAADSVQGTMLNDDVADDSTIEVSSNNLSVLKVPNALTAGAGIAAGGTFDGAAARTFSVDSASFAPFFSASMNDFTTTGTGSFGGDISASGTIFANQYYVDGNLAISYASAYRFGFANTIPIEIGKANNPVLIRGSITASNISASKLTLTGLSTQGSETTAVMINGSDVVGTRDLGSNAFTSTTIGTTTNALTAGDGLNNGGGTFTGATARTFSIDSASFAPFFSASMNNFTTTGTASFGGDVSASGILKGISVSTPGTVTADSITLTGLSNQGSEATAVMINGSDVVGTRELGSNAFTSTTIGTTTNALTAGAGILAAGTFNGAAARTFSIDSASFAPFFSASMNDFTTTGTGSFGGDVSASGFIRGIGLDINGGADVGGTIELQKTVVNGDLEVVENIIHHDDSDTKIVFGADSITMTAGNVEMLKLVESVADAVVLNEGAADVNLRVESSNKTHMLFVDAGNDTVGIDNAAPPQALTVTGNISASGEIEVPHRFFDTGSSLLGSSAGNVQGDIVKFGGSTTVAGAIYQLKTGGVWEQTDADAAATATGSIAVAMGTNSTTNGMCLRGVVNLNHDPGGGEGAPIYLSTNAGSSSNAAPSGNNDIARIIGYNLNTSGQIYFNPDNTFVEVTA